MSSVRTRATTASHHAPTTSRDLTVVHSSALTTGAQPTVLGPPPTMAAEPPLIVRENSYPPPEAVEHRNEVRRERYRRRDVSRAALHDVLLAADGYERLSATEVVSTDTGEIITVDMNGADRWARPPRVARCSWTIGQAVSVHHDGGDAPAHFSGLEHCGSVWACPVCAGVIRAKRADEIQQIVKAHQDDGGDLLFFTGTLRHHNGDDLKQTLAAIGEAWTRTVSGNPWTRKRDALGIIGQVRTIEITHGSNGWHPHAHVLLLLDSDRPRLTTKQLDDFRTWLFARWTQKIEALGCKRPTSEGLDLQQVDRKGRVIAQYISKVQDDKTPKRWHVGAEAARADLKKGHGESRTPFELLDGREDVDNRHCVDERDMHLWREYYLATKGKNAITFSRGLRDRFDIETKTDEQIIEDTTAAQIVWTSDADDFRALRRRAPEQVPMILEAAERQDWDAIDDLIGGHHVAGEIEGPPPVLTATPPSLTSPVKDAPPRPQLTPATASPTPRRGAVPGGAHRFADERSEDGNRSALHFTCEGQEAAVLSWEGEAAWPCTESSESASARARRPRRRSRRTTTAPASRASTETRTSTPPART